MQKKEIVTILSKLNKNLPSNVGRYAVNFKAWLNSHQILGTN